MLCCAALAAVVGLIRCLWFTLPGTGEPQDPGFPPSATRSSGESSVIAGLPSSSHRGATGWERAACRSFGLGLVVYAAALPFLHLAEWITYQPAAKSWVLRTGAIAVVAVVGLAMPTRSGRPARQRRGCVLIGLGSAWFVGGVLDMHVLGLTALSHDSLAADLVFHGSGSLLVTLGLVMVVRTDRAARSQNVPQLRPIGAP